MYRIRPALFAAGPPATAPVGEPLTPPPGAVAARGGGRGGRVGPWRLSPAYAFLAPFMLSFLVLFIVPILYALYLSLHSQMGDFIGLDNYTRALHDSDFFTALGRMLLFFVVQVPIMLGLATVFALLLDSSVLRLKVVFRIGIFIPYAIPGVIAALLWGFLYSPTVGPLSHLGPLAQINLLASGTLLWSIANIVTWEYTGYNMLILFAALQAIPHDLYEAARIDGANGLQIAWFIKVRLLLPALVLATVFSIIGTLQLFNEPSIMAAITSAPSNYTPNLYINSLHGVGVDSYAAALAFVLAAVTFVFSVAFMYTTSRGGMSS